MFDRVMTKAQAKERVKSRYGEGLIGYLIFVTCVGVVSGMVAVIPLVGIIAALGLSSVASVLMAGYFLRYYMDQPVDLCEVFASIKDNWLRWFGAIMWAVLWSFIWALPMCLGAVLVGIGTGLATLATTPFSSAAVVCMVLGVLVYIAAIVLMIIKVLGYSLVGYILYEYPTINYRKALKTSIKLMEGHKGELFVLGLSFIGWGLLNVLTLGLLDIFYAGPYYQATLAGFYAQVKILSYQNHKVSDEDFVLAGIVGVPQPPVEGNSSTML